MIIVCDDSLKCYIFNCHKHKQSFIMSQGQLGMSLLQR